LISFNRKSIFQNKNITLLWLGQVVSQSGDSIYQIGLLWITLELSGSESMTGLVAMSAYLPAVILSVLAGAIADSGDKKKIMLTADLFRFLIVLIIPIAFGYGILTPLFLGINAFGVAIAATFFNPSRDSLIPFIVPKEGLLRANSLVQTSWQFALLFGPAVAGVLLHFVGKINLFAVDAFFYLASFSLIFFIRPQIIKKDNVSEVGVSFADIREGIAYAFRHSVILPLLLLTIADNIFIMGPAIVGTPVFVKVILGRGAESYALIQGCYAVGMLLGTAIVIYFGGKFNKGSILLVGMILDGITYIPMYFVNSMVALEIVIVVHSLSIPLLTVVRASLIQDIVPPRLIGRVFALMNIAVVGMTAISSGLSGFAMELVGPQMLFLIIGIGGGLCGVIGWIFAKDLRRAA